MTPARSFRLATALFIGATALAGSSQAQEFPSGTIRILVPTGPSTPPDIISRVIAGEIANAEGWKVIVENRPGAMMTIAGGEVLKNAANGMSIYAMSVPVTAAPAFMPNIPFRLDKDFAPVVEVSRSYNVLVVHPSVPAKSISELVAYLKANPDKATFSSGGYGTPAHLIGEMFKLQTGVRATHVPYQQFPQAITDLLSGTNQYMFITMLPVLELIKSGKLRALAVTAPSRLAALPDVPTVIEEGFPGLVVEDWVGFAVRSGTPSETVASLNRAVNRALAKMQVRKALAKLSAEPAGGTPAVYGDLIERQLAHWAQVVKDSGMKMQQ
jgi:tripartite-type tricarboxylate transporter receptor subunit TctC